MTDIVLDPLRWQSLEAGGTAIVGAWLASEGDHVHAGQALAQVLLRGERIELQAPHAGVLEQIVVPAGERFDPAHVLARLVEF